ncbi:hypothetical protein [Planctomyces sp. SH-PL62]|uniref:hypothetical protein n=1 Tax=Planctomyces sp. SH-PL62 TaxID=1636152 RepID=UPI00078D2D5C|nr:hypothetical protein [Planctomyces sp. SH-PL62]AMV40455.1 hypothetical protein VT85_23700 [Planctomyces sp. SH-PL62]
MHLKRIEGRYYAYESARRDGRSTSRCWGRMPDLFVPACLEVARDCRETREADAAIERRKQARLLAPLVALRDGIAAYGAEVDAAVAEALGSLGYHRRRRGPWRKKRGADVGETTTIQVTRTNLGQLLHLANKGDALAAERLPAALDAAARSGGDIETETASLVLDVLPAPKEPAEARVELMRRELAPPGSSPVVRLMASRVVCDWLHVQTWERYLALAWGNKHPMSAGTLRLIEKNFDQAVRRYQASLVALARIQRLRLPVVAQVNIAEAGSRQVNQAAVR